MAAPEQGSTRGGGRERAALPLTDSAALETLRDEWAALHADAGAGPFVHPAWHEAWLRHFGAGTAPLFLAVREAPGRRRRAASDDADGGDDGDSDGDEAEALPPLRGVMALDMARPGEARMLGDHNVRDYGGPLAAPGYEELVARGVLEWLAEDMTPSLELRGIPADGVLQHAFGQVAEGLGWTLEAEAEAVAPFAALPATFEEFVQGLPKHDRHELRRKLRNLEAAGAVTFACAEDAESVEGCMDEFLNLMRVSRPDKDAFLTPAMEGFFRDLAATFASVGMARIETLRLDGAPVAMLFTFEAGRVSYLYNSGFDPACANLAVGLLSKAISLREAIARGCHTFDFLRGDEEYKRRLGGRPRELVTLRLRYRG
ncbi:MAG: GNAT family N-acetyltransferase [Dehalococcoidia bacterium]